MTKIVSRACRCSGLCVRFTLPKAHHPTQTRYWQEIGELSVEGTKCSLWDWGRGLQQSLEQCPVPLKLRPCRQSLIMP